MSLPDVTPTVTQILPSYIYQEFSDDQDLQAFAASYNTLAQAYLDWFSSANLPIYTTDPISGALLDWIGTGVYDIKRPALPNTNKLFSGPFNSVVFDTISFNDQVEIFQSIISPGVPIGSFAIGISAIGETITPAPSGYYASDDIYRRVITWAFFKGDGKVFNINWLKRRIMRFLLGTDGVNYNVDQTYRISITFSPNQVANINIISGSVQVLAQTTFNGFGFNTEPFDYIDTLYTPYTPFALAPIFKIAADAGILELPFQWTWNISIGAA